MESGITHQAFAELAYYGLFEALAPGLTAVLPNRHFRKLRFHPVLLPISASATKSCGTLSDNVVSKFCLPDKILWNCKYSMVFYTMYERFV
ncbi:hypothetical protein SRHO_G00101420 [Serrasalmus rhombeus]